LFLPSILVNELFSPYAGGEQRSCDADSHSSSFQTGRSPVGTAERNDSVARCPFSLWGNIRLTNDFLIKIPENDFRALIDRDKIAAEINEHLRPWTSLLRDLVSYGSNLIPRCYSSSGKSLKDAVLLAILLRQVVAMLDGVDLLLSSGAVYAATLQLRALFEASVYIEWILGGDSERKADYYYVHNLRRKRMWASRVQPASPESQEFLEFLNKSGISIDENTRKASQKELQEIDRILSQAKFATISSDIEKHRKRKHDPAWYVPLGEHNLGTMARTVGKHSQYVFLYSPASEVIHVSNYGHHVRFGKGEIVFQPIRSVEGFENVFRFTTINALLTFRAVLQEYRPGELDAFRRKYMEKWQKEFINFPKIAIRVESTRI
jgi:hypothetical protein